MPLVIVTGFPSSGKTSAVNKLVKFFEDRDKAVCVVSEEALLGGLEDEFQVRRAMGWDGMGWDGMEWNNQV